MDHSTSESHEENISETPVCVLAFNHNDATGASGLSADTSAILSSGVHALPVVTAVCVRDTHAVFDLLPLPSETVEEQARSVLQDVDVSLIKIGFAGSPEALACIAEICSDYEGIPVLAQLPSLPWWEQSKIEEYLDALMELVLPQTSVLVGSYEQMWHWLLPEWQSAKKPSPRDIATSAALRNVPYVVITGVNATAQNFETVVATAQTVLLTLSLDRLEGGFVGAGDTFSASLAALLASGSELMEAVQEASIYVHSSLHAAFSPGMGAAVPERLFWAQSTTQEDTKATPIEPISEAQQPSITQPKVTPATP